VTCVWNVLPKAAVFLAAIFLFALPLVGCSRAAHRSVAVIPRLSSDARWLSLHVGIAAQAERAGLEAHWSGPSEESNTAEQIALTEDAIRRRVFGIVLEPSALVATNNVVRKAQRMRIPVALVGEGAGMPEGEHLYQILNDTNEAGRLVARRVLELAHSDGEVAILGLRAEVPGNIERADAITEALKRLAPELAVLKKSMDSSSISYEQRNLREFIRIHPRLKVLVALSAQESHAAVAAIRAENAGERIRIIGCDQTMALLLMLRAGAFDSLVVQDMPAMGRLAVDAVVSDRQARAFPAVSIVKPILVTPSNIDSDAVQRTLLMHKEETR